MADQNLYYTPPAAAVGYLNWFRVRFSPESQPELFSGRRCSCHYTAGGALVPVSPSVIRPVAHRDTTSVAKGEDIYRQQLAAVVDGGE